MLRVVGGKKTMRYARTVLAAVCGFISLTAPAARAAVYTEELNGDMSNSGSGPSLLNLTIGSNTISATTMGGDQDYLRLSVPAGAAIQSLTLQTYAGNDGIAFLGLQAGPTFTESPDNPDPGGMLGYTHFGTFAGNVGTNVLPSMRTAPGAQGFTIPLTGSDYTLWFQQLGAPATYTFNAVVTPEPGSGFLLLGAAGALVLRRRRAR